MVFTIQSCALVGLDPYAVVCEVDLSRQLPNFTLVGLPSSMTQESRERIRSAVTNSGFDWPARKITINMLPASLPKWGSHFELGMALGILGVTNELSAAFTIFAVGELSLAGEIRPCGWLSAIAPWLKKMGAQVRAQTGEPMLVVAHEKDIKQLAMSDLELSSVCELVGVRDLASAYAAVFEASARLGQGAKKADLEQLSGQAAHVSPLSTLALVRNEPLAVAAALVAIAGRHHALFAGPHGMGKSMVIRGICEAHRPLNDSQNAERATTLTMFGEPGLAGLENPAVYLQTSISRAALEGALLNSGQVLPGEMTRAHLGILVADELLEFRRDVIEAMRQPLEERIVRLQRAKFRAALPANFQFLASTNLCPCGLWGQNRRPCRCRKALRDSYQQKLSGPIMDRFDLIVIVGHRASSSRLTQIPPDLVSAVDALVNPDSWTERLERATKLLAQNQVESASPAELWSQLPVSASDRGRLKLARLSKTLAALLGERRELRHLRLALLLRQDLDLVLREENRDNYLDKSAV